MRRTLSLTKCPQRGIFFKVLFGAALVWGALGLLGCETEGDSGSSVPLTGPRSIQITAKSTSLVVQWTKVAVAQGISPSYEVWYGTAPNTASATKLSEDIPAPSSNLVIATITGLTNEIIYYVWVKAVFGELGKSDFSPVEYAIPIPPPSTPTNIHVTPSEQMLEVTWPEVKNAFTYEVYYGNTGGGATPPAGTEMVTVSDTGAVIFGLSNGTNYTLWVRAKNTAGDSTNYGNSSGTPLAGTSAPTTAPGKLTVTPGSNKLTLTWDQVPGVPAYKVYYHTSNDSTSATLFSQTIPASAPKVSADITGLTNNTLYYVWVKSSNSQGESSFSPFETGTPLGKATIKYGDLQFELGRATAEYIYAQDLPPSRFFPDGRPNTDRLPRVQETALGNLFTDGVAWYLRKTCPEETIDLVFINGGYIDNGLLRGTLTVGSISNITQSDQRQDKIMLLTLTGTQLRAFFEEVADVVHSGRGGPPDTKFFGQVSKEARYTIQYFKPPEETTPEFSSDESEPYLHGIIKPGTLKINGADIEDSKNYRIATTTSLASGLFFITLYEGIPAANKRSIDTPFWHGVAEYIYDQGNVTPKLDGRIKIEGGVPLPAPWVPGDRIKE